MGTMNGDPIRIGPDDRELVPTVLGRAIREDGREFRQGDEILLNQSCYNGIVGPQWTTITSIAPGTAAVYPIKYQVLGYGHEGHIGQAKPSEIVEVRRTEAALRAEAFFEEQGQAPHLEHMTPDTFRDDTFLGEDALARRRAVRVHGGERPPDD